MTMQFAPPLLDYGNMTIPGLTAPTPGNAYRASPTHSLLSLLTPRSTSLDRPGLMPNFTNVNSGLALQMQVGSYNNPIYPTGYPGQAPSGQFPAPSGGTTTADFDLTVGNVNWKNIRAVVGPVDINRRLSDYRDLTLLVNTPTPGPLDYTTVTPLSVNQASMERQNLARDIFIRLAVAAGAWIRFDGAGNPFVDPLCTPGTAEFDALRYIAQLAVNIVDYIDNDDVSTPFIWNPLPSTQFPGGALTPMTNPNYLPADPTGYTTILSSHLAAADMGNRVVFGVEKPRLVINEVYSEVTNNTQDTGNNNATRPAQVK
jgi:hypothetical protein